MIKTMIKEIQSVALLYDFSRLFFKVFLNLNIKKKNSQPIETVLAKDRTLQLAFFPKIILLEKIKNLFKQKIFIKNLC